MTDYRTGIPVALETVRTMGDITRNIKGMLDQLDSDVRDGLREWPGDARNAYDASKARWGAAADQMSVSLGEAQVALGQLIDDYLRTERYSATLWHAVDGG